MRRISVGYINPLLKGTSEPLVCVAESEMIPERCQNGNQDDTVRVWLSTLRQSPLSALKIVLK